MRPTTSLTEMDRRGLCERVMLNRLEVRPWQS
jgi:hypothetical protein